MKSVLASIKPKYCELIADGKKRFEIRKTRPKINTPCNPLYCEFSRVGCIGCPMAGKHRYDEFHRYPKYEQMYIHAFDRMLEARRQNSKQNKPSWQNSYDVFRWWLEENPDQYEIGEEFYEEE